MPDTSRRTLRGRGLCWGLALLSLLGVVAAGGPGPALGAEGAWELSRSPAGFVAGATATIRLVVGPGPELDDDVGCVTVTIPPAFDVTGVAILAAPAGANWTVAASGTTIVVAHAVGGGDRLEGATGQSITIGVTVTGSAVGNYSWTADADRSQNCMDGPDAAKSFGVAITAAPPTPAPTPPPTPPPTPAPTPPPGATPTPAPTPPPGPTAPPAPTPPPGGVTPPPTAEPSSSSVPTDGGSPSPTVAPTPGPSGSTSPSPSPIIGGGPSAPTSPPGVRFTIPAVGRGAPPIQGDLSSDLAARFSGALDWAVPGLVLSVPGLLLVLAVLAQSLGALAWLPIVRRRIGAFGLRRRRSPGARA